MVSVHNFFQTKAKTGDWKSLYDLKNPSSYPFTIRLEKTIKILQKNIKGKKVCDLGCGTGALIPFVVKSGAKYTGVDFSIEMLNKIKYNVNFKQLNLDLINGDFSKLNFNKKFDVLVGLGFIEYFENSIKIIKKCKLIMKKDGLLLLSFPNRICLDFLVIRLLYFLRIFLKFFFKIGKDNPKRKMWSYKEAKKVLNSNGFEIIRVENYYTNLLVYPFTVLFPNLSFSISRFIEKTFLNNYRFLNGGFLILSKIKK